MFRKGVGVKRAIMGWFSVRLRGVELFSLDFPGAWIRTGRLRASLPPCSLSLGKCRQWPWAEPLQKVGLNCGKASTGCGTVGLASEEEGSIQP